MCTCRLLTLDCIRSYVQSGSLHGKTWVLAGNEYILHKGNQIEIWNRQLEKNYRMPRKHFLPLAFEKTEAGVFQVENQSSCLGRYVQCVSKFKPACQADCLRGPQDLQGYRTGNCRSFLLIVALFKTLKQTLVIQANPETRPLSSLFLRCSFPPASS